MAVDAGDRAIIERWVGTLAAVDDQDIEQRLSRLGSPYPVALEMLMVQYSNVVRDPLRMRIDGDATWENDRNVVELRSRIAALASLCEGLPGMNLNARDLCTEATSAAMGGDVVRIIAYDVEGVRPGA